MKITNPMLGTPKGHSFPTPPLPDAPQLGRLHLELRTHRRHDGLALHATHSLAVLNPHFISADYSPFPTLPTAARPSFPSYTRPPLTLPASHLSWCLV